MIFFIAYIQGGIGPILSIYLRSNLGWDTSQVGMALATTGIVNFTGFIIFNNRKRPLPTACPIARWYQRRHFWSGSSSYSF